MINHKYIIAAASIVLCSNIFAGETYTTGTIDVYFSDTISEDIYKDMSVEELRDYVREIIKEFVD